jgi:L-alanine-DL-glutamate epimerase-like enolase superfamily enzyme
VLEQWLPKDDLAGMRRLRRESGWLVAADEAVTTAEDARRVVRARAADVINIKLMKAGLGEALEIARIARAGGVGLMIGGNVESVLTEVGQANLAMSEAAAEVTRLAGELETTASLATGQLAFRDAIDRLVAEARRRHDAVREVLAQTAAVGSALENGSFDRCADSLLAEFGHSMSRVRTPAQGRGRSH